MINWKIVKYICALLYLCCAFSASAFASAVNIMQDTETDNIINKISSPILDKIKIRGQVKFYLNNDISLNAFAASGREVYLNSGLIINCETPEMLAGVIAHELGHIKANHIHGIKEQRKQDNAIAIMSTLVGIVTSVVNSDVGVSIALGGQNLAVTNSAAYSQTQENIADDIAIRTLKEAKISTLPITKLMKKIYVREKIMDSDGGSQYWRTHPLSKDRIEHFTKNSSDGKGYSDEIALEYALARAKIMAYYKYPLTGYNAKIVTMYYNAYKDFWSSGHNAYSLAQELLKHNNQNPYFNELIAQIHFRKHDYKNFRKHYELAIKFAHPNNHVMIAEYVGNLLSLCDQSKDKEIINTSLALLKNLNENDYLKIINLIHCYKLLDDNEKYYYYLARINMAYNDLGKAKHFAKLAKKYSHKESKYYIKIEDILNDSE